MTLRTEFTLYFDVLFVFLFSAPNITAECLLAIIEFNQLQEHCIEHFHDYLSSRYDYNAKILELPPDIPQSLIVYGSNEAHSKRDNELAISLESVVVKREKSLEPLNGLNRGQSRLSVLKWTGKEDESHKHYETASGDITPGDVTPSDDIEMAVTRQPTSPPLKRTKSKGLYADLKPLQNRMRLLYQKYIQSRAEYQINIRCVLRVFVSLFVICVF